MSNEELVKLAIGAKQHAFVPFSEFKVGAALLSSDGKVYEGANMECSSYGLTICAERVALLKALYDGERTFSKLAVVGGNLDELIYCTPCGACRQFLSDFGGELEIIIGYMENEELKIKSFKLYELLPEAFKF